MAATGGSFSHLVGRVSAQKVGSDSAPQAHSFADDFWSHACCTKGFDFLCLLCAFVGVWGGYHACDVRPPVSAPRRGRGRGGHFSPEALAASHHQQPHPGACAEASVLVFKTHLRRAMCIFVKS